MKVFKKLFVTLFLASLMAVGVTACDTSIPSSESSENSSSSTIVDPTYALTLTADKATAKPGEKVTLTATLTADGEEIDADDVVFEITAGVDSAKLKNNVLTISSEAKANDVITVIAKIGATKSDPVSVTVNVPLEKVEVSAKNDVTNVRAGASVELQKTITPANADASKFAWTVTEGNQIASMVGDVLVVNENAKTGATITVEGAIGDKKDTISFIVGYPLTDLNVTVQGSANIPAGQSVDLKVEKIPENTTNGSYRWEKVTNGDYFTIENDKLTILASAPDNAEIQFKAVSEDGVESELITVTIGIAIESLSLSADLPEVLVKGQSYNVLLVAQPMAASTRNVEWVINDEAKEYVDGHFNVANNTYTFTVNETIPSGTPFSIQAVSGTVSDKLEGYKVGIALESVSLTMNGKTNVDAGDARVLNVSYNPENATDKEVTWIFTEGETLCTIVNNVLTVNEGVEIGSKISFKASVAGIESEETIKIIVGTPIEGIVIAASNLEVVKGTSSTLYITEVTPADAKLDSISWSYTGENVTIEGNQLIVSKDAITDSIIKVVATSGDAVSNELVFTVRPTQEEINASQYLLTVSEDEIRFDKNENSYPVLIAEVYDLNGQLVTDKNIIFTVSKGDTLLEISTDNGVCNFVEANGHGEATISIIVEGTALSETTDVIVIVPPTDINLPGAFTGIERANQIFDFSLKDALPFVATPVGTKVCQDIIYLFEHEDGTTGADVATYANGNITFKKPGKVTVTASSNSGSRIEMTKSYSFNINEGKNVYSFEELKYYVEYNYDGITEVNMVALEPISGPKLAVSVNEGKATYSQSGTIDYGYAFVPAVALASIERQNFDALYNKFGATINVDQNGLNLNGNNYTIDASQIRPLTQAEMEAGHLANNNAADTSAFTGSLIQFFSLGDQSHTISIKDLSIKGNTPIDYAGEIDSNAKAIGVPLSGICVSDLGSPNVHYYLTIKNVKIEGFQHGLRMTKVVDGLIENVTATNCYTDGIVCRSSIVTLRNVKLSKCGATGIEFAPESSNKAGINNDQNQKVIIDGNIEALGMLSDGNTRYFSNYMVDMGGTVGKIPAPAAINGLLGQLGLNDTQISNMRNSQNQFAIIALLFHSLEGANVTEITYPADVTNSMVNALQLDPNAKDTTHKYILLPLMTSATSSMGNVLLYNLNYVG